MLFHTNNRWSTFVGTRLTFFSSSRPRFKFTPTTYYATITVSPKMQIMPLPPQQQFAPVFPPRTCQLGGASRASRRTNCHKSRNLAALPVLPARQRGDKFLRCMMNHAERISADNLE